MVVGKHHFTLEQRREIYALRQAGNTYKQIGNKIGKAPSAICYEIARCEKGKYDPEKSHADYLKIKRGKNPRKSANLTSRVESLEEQVKIITEILRNRK